MKINAPNQTVARLTGTFAQLHAAGCIQTGADVEWRVGVAEAQFGPMFRLLTYRTDGKPCDGCPAFNSGKCEAYQQYKALPPAAAPKADYLPEHPGMSVRQIAAKLGVSIGEVRRMKQARV
jgi:hypothetical protein